MISWALATNGGFTVIYKQPFLKLRGMEVDHVYLFLENCKWRDQENCIQFKITQQKMLPFH